ncbi:hypothetical protein AKJ09_09833 [Labilithrix luteola]|uniref:Uncharacterized protein n=1 Tax=Labilithrix luteola TaxID=1391654 RepID=A0A0K1QCL4_9BACT|nr:hypothetical protein AKJ09_09833 [Labilithrix luteola]
MKITNPDSGRVVSLNDLSSSSVGMVVREMRDAARELWGVAS